eukprot:scaffold12470_cov119-Isochrysis_galbana.AAC.10
MRDRRSPPRPGRYARTHTPSHRSGAATPRAVEPRCTPTLPLHRPLVRCRTTCTTACPRLRARWTTGARGHPRRSGRPRGWTDGSVHATGVTN